MGKPHAYESAFFLTSVFSQGTLFIAINAALRITLISGDG
jgi:hypothetical protein